MFNQLKLRKIASGHFALQLDENYGWEDLPKVGEWLETNLGFRIISKADAVDMRIWDVKFKDVVFELVYEDYPNRTSLESDCDTGDRILSDLLEQLEGQ